MGAAAHQPHSVDALRLQLTVRLAKQTRDDHQQDVEMAGPPRCAGCGQPWPCEPRRWADQSLRSMVAHSGSPVA